MNKKKIATMALASALVANFVPVQDAFAKVKCKGVAFAGENDCGANGHGCGGQAEHHLDKNEWVYVKDEATCGKLKAEIKKLQAMVKKHKLGH